jgi:5-methylphenazine-1-carboxylate 1-monooxygenase
VAALKAYEARRVAATAAVVLMNRTDPPDSILREVHLRTGDKPFDSIDKVISRQEIQQRMQRYRQVTGASVQSVVPV